MKKPIASPSNQKAMTSKKSNLHNLDTPVNKLKSKKTISNHAKRQGPTFEGRNITRNSKLSTSASLDDLQKLNVQTQNGKKKGPVSKDGKKIVNNPRSLECKFCALPSLNYYLMQGHVMSIHDQITHFC